MPLLLFSGDILSHDLEPNSRLEAVLHRTLDDWLTSDQNTDQVTDRTDIAKALKSTTATKFYPPEKFFPGCARCGGQEDSLSNHTTSQCTDVTLKLFLPKGITANKAVAALNEALTSHSTYLVPQKFKSLILSFEGLNFSDSTAKDFLLENDQLADIWRVITAAAQKYCSIEEYGVAELSTLRLKTLFQNIESFNDPSIPYPSINQINAVDCCALPPGLLLFSRERNIRLLAHHDTDEMMGDDEMERLVEKIGVCDSKKLEWNWILRMTSVVLNRQVLTANKYLLSIREKHT